MSVVRRGVGGAVGWSTSLLQARLGTRFVVVDHGGWIEIVEHDGRHLAIVSTGPGPCLETTASIVLAEEDAEPDVRAEAADAAFREDQGPFWEAHGFALPDVGECHGVDVNEDIDGEEQIVWSYEIALTRALTADDDLPSLITWLCGAPLDLVWWGGDGPLTVAEPSKVPEPGR